MDFELISAEEFNALPEDDEQCFVEFEAICRRNMTQMMDSQRVTLLLAVAGNILSAPSSTLIRSLTEYAGARQAGYLH